MNSGVTNRAWQAGDAQARTLTSAATAPRVKPLSPMLTLQIGMGWFPELGGGLDRYYFELTRALRTVAVQSVGLVAGTGQVRPSTTGGITAPATPSAPLLMRWSAFRRHARALLREHSVDVIASHFALYSYPLLRLIAGRPHVVHFHGPWAAEGRAEGSGALVSLMRARLERRVYHRADRLVVLSNAFADVLTRTYGVKDGLIHVVPGGVDCPRFGTGPSRADARATFGWPRDRRIVLCVRRLARRMGLADLIAAAAKLRRAVPDVLVLIAGKGELHAALQSQINDAGLAGHVRLLGFIADAELPAAYRAADLTVVPTIALEGFGLIAAESLAAGVPALVTPVGGLPEVVCELSPNLILPGTGADILADGIEQALTGRLPLPSPAECRTFACEKYDWPIIAARIREIYEASRNLA